MKAVCLIGLTYQESCCLWRANYTIFSMLKCQRIIEAAVEILRKFFVLLFVIQVRIRQLTPAVETFIYFNRSIYLRTCQMSMTSITILYFIFYSFSVHTPSYYILCCPWWYYGYFRRVDSYAEKQCFVGKYYFHLQG